MKHRYVWCDATCRELNAGTPYQVTAFRCSNLLTDYAMTWLPTFCPVCGGKLTGKARSRYARGNGSAARSTD